VIDDDGHSLYRGERMAVCDKTFRLYVREGSPYAHDLIAIEPYDDIPLELPKPLIAQKCAASSERNQRQDYKVTEIGEDRAVGRTGVVELASSSSSFGR
jgi:hypothetical protein